MILLPRRQQIGTIVPGMFGCHTIVLYKYCTSTAPTVRTPAVSDHRTKYNADARREAIERKQTHRDQPTDQASKRPNGWVGLGRLGTWCPDSEATLQQHAPIEIDRGLIPFRRGGTHQRMDRRDGPASLAACACRCSAVQCRPPPPQNIPFLSIRPPTQTLLCTCEYVCALYSYRFFLSFLMQLCRG